MQRDKIVPIMLTIALICLIVTFISEVTVWKIVLAIFDTIVLCWWACSE